MNLSLKTSRVSWASPLLAVLITLGVCLYVMALYLQGPLQGNFNQFFMPAQMFGVPADLRAHGIQELYTGPVQTGWDGQFYYYIANDPLALKDTPAHIDSPAYRYQRIGLPLLAYVVSKVTGQSWVNPLTYYLTSLCVILLAVGRAAFFFQRQKINPTIILCWSLACGTLMTQLNGLPDAAADGFLIIALVSLVERQLLIAMFAMLFAALSREVYILLPIGIIAWTVIENLKPKGLKNFLKLNNGISLLKQCSLYFIPIIIFLAWQIFIRIRFPAAPSAQAFGILGFPFMSTVDALWYGLSGHHPLASTEIKAYFEGLGVVLYVLLLLLSGVMLIRFWLVMQPRDPIMGQGVASTFLIIIILYFCFGPTVMMHHTGYFKAANIFLFMIPFLLAWQHRRLNRAVFLFLLCVVLYFDLSVVSRISLVPY